MLDASAVSDRLGYTPVNKAGDTLTGPLTLGGKLDRQMSADGTAIEVRSSYAGNQKIFEVAQSGSDGVVYLRDALGNLSTISSYSAAYSSLKSKLLLPNQPSFSAYSPAVTATGNNVIYGSTRHNTGNCYNTSNGRFTAPVTGVYIFTFNSLMNVNSDYVRLWFNVNNVHNPTYGDTLSGGSLSGGAWTGWSYISIGLTLVIQLTANDWVSVWNDGPTATWGTGYGTFSGHLLS